ncbi:MAG: HEPN domain-containing protein [Deltaproteobacteria bacterium]|nr:HEPN domain-containing protein [Deltaproteobacteria bacterium]
MAKLSKEIQKWIDIAQEDLEVARELFKSGRYLYSAFFCQQAVEKIFKAIISFKTNEEPPYIHDLVMLAEKAGFHGVKEKLKMLTLHYIKARYDEERKNLPAHKKTVCRELLSFAEEVLKWSSMRFK